MSIIKTIQKLEKHWALWTTLYSRRARNKKSKLIKTNDKHGLEKTSFQLHFCHILTLEKCQMPK